MIEFRERERERSDRKNGKLSARMLASLRKPGAKHCPPSPGLDERVPPGLPTSGLRGTPRKLHDED